MVTRADNVDSVLRPCPSVRSSTSVDGLVLLDTAGGLILSANPVGARIWRLIEQGLADADIARQVAAEYAVAIERAEADVDAFLESLIARGLVLRDRIA